MKLKKKVNIGRYLVGIDTNVPIKTYIMFIKIKMCYIFMCN